MKKLLTILLVFLFCNTLYGSTENETDKNNVSIDLWTGYSPLSTAFFAKMRNTRLMLMGIGFNYANIHFGGNNLQLSSELVLFGTINFPIDGLEGPRSQRSGLGVIPLRISFPFTKGSSGSFPYAEAGLGLFLFEDRFPNKNGTLLNVTIDFGIGYNFKMTESNSLAIGYRFHHLSNAGAGSVNPGLDSNMILLRLRTNL